MTTIEPKRKDQSMTGIYVLLGFAALMLFAAVFMYSRSDSNNYDLAIEKIGSVQTKVDHISQSIEADRASLNKIVEDMATLFDQMAALQSQISNAKRDWYDGDRQLKREFEIISVRQKTLEKRVAEVKTRSVNLNLTNPIMVDIIEKAKTPVGKGQESLLKKSGVIQSTKDH